MNRCFHGSVFTLALLLTATVGCRSPKRSSQAQPSAPNSQRGYPGTLVSTTEMGRPFFARQKIVAHWNGRDRAFDAVLELQQGVLTVIALTPFGTKAFVIRQVGTNVEHIGHVERSLPFSPKYVLLDVHRTLFMAVPGAPLADGVHEHERDGERIIEAWNGGRLLRRSFERLDRSVEGAIVATYGAGWKPGLAPPTVRLRNGWFGYRLTIETVEFRPL